MKCQQRFVLVKMALLFHGFLDIFTVALVLRYVEFAWEYRTKFPILAYFWLAFGIIYCVAIGTRWGTGYYLKKRRNDLDEDRIDEREE